MLARVDGGFGQSEYGEDRVGAVVLRAGPEREQQGVLVLAQHWKIQKRARGVGISVKREAVDEPAATWVRSLGGRYMHSGRV